MKPPPLESSPVGLLVGIGDPRSRGSWSGTPFHAARALEAHYRIITLGPLPSPEPWSFDWLRRFYSRAGLGWFAAELEPSTLRAYASAIHEAIKEHRPDFVLAIHANPLAYLETDLPVFFLHDTTFAGLVDYYPEFSGLAKRSIRNGHRMQQRASDVSTAAFYSSAWAAESARKVYGMPAEKVHIVPLGANLETPPTREEVLAMIADRRGGNVCELLFVGVNWERKGGPAMVELAKVLRERGEEVLLHLVGCRAPVEVEALPFVRSYGFLSKADPAQAAELKSLFARASFLIVLSKAECYGCVYCEANAFGMPAIGRETGGVSEIIHDGRNGLLLGAQESLADYAERILALWREKPKYAAMSICARDEFERRLNWGAFAEGVSQVIDANFARRERS